MVTRRGAPGAAFGVPAREPEERAASTGQSLAASHRGDQEMILRLKARSTSHTHATSITTVEAMGRPELG